MGHTLLCLVLSVTALGVAEEVGEDEFSWLQGKVPLVKDRQTLHLSRPRFTSTAASQPIGMCGIECQRALPQPGLADLERLLSYETVYENGSRTLTEVSLQGLETRWGFGAQRGWWRPRHRRELFGPDSRFSIADARFSTRYPFSATVRVSTGCSGVLLSPKHVLTAAHCIHDGQNYLKGAQKLRVGVLKVRSRGSRGKGRKRMREERQGEKPRLRKSRSPVRERPSFRWTRVQLSQIPKGWFQDTTRGVAADYDYALLELKRSQKQKPMDLGIVTSVKKLPAGRVHFSGFDDDRPGQLVYRFCSVSEESSDLLYQYCDAQPGSSGSGVYIRLKEPGKRKWKRKIIGVFSGHQRVDVNGTHQDYNVAVRITPLKYAQICRWVHGESAVCDNT